MDRFTIAASAASAAIIGAAAIASWMPAAEAPANSAQAQDSSKVGLKSAALSRSACPPHHSSGTLQSGSETQKSTFSDLAEPLALAAYAPANYGGALARIRASARGSVQAEADASAGDASSLALDAYSQAADGSTGSQPGRNALAALSGGDGLASAQALAAAGRALEAAAKSAPVKIVEEEFLSVAAESAGDLPVADSNDGGGLLSANALALFASMSTEQIEAYSRLAAMIRNPELAERIMPSAAALAEGLPLLGPRGDTDLQNPTPATSDELPEWAAFESPNGDIRLLLGEEEATGIKVEKGVVVGALGRVERIAKGESELAVLFESGKTITGAALDRPPSAPVLRPASLEGMRN